MFLEAGLRVPLPRYNAEIIAQTYSARFEARLASENFSAMLQKLSPKELVNEGLRLRKFYAKQFEPAWKEFASSKSPIRKWKLSKVRYLLGRTMLVGSMEDVREISELITSEPEVAEYAAMFAVLQTGNADSLLPFGWRVAASVGQILAAASIDVTCKSVGWKNEHVEAYTTLRLAGVIVNGKLPQRLNEDPRLRAIIGNQAASAWVNLPYSFYREFGALMGKKALEKHQEVLQSPIDPEERWEVFADELLGLEPT